MRSLKLPMSKTYLDWQQHQKCSMEQLNKYSLNSTQFLK